MTKVHIEQLRSWGYTWEPVKKWQCDFCHTKHQTILIGLDEDGKNYNVCKHCGVVRGLEIPVKCISLIKPLQKYPILFCLGKGTNK